MDYVLTSAAMFSMGTSIQFMLSREFCHQLQEHGRLQPQGQTSMVSDTRRIAGPPVPGSPQSSLLLPMLPIPGSQPNLEHNTQQETEAGGVVAVSSHKWTGASALGGGGGDPARKQDISAGSLACEVELVSGGEAAVIMSEETGKSAGHEIKGQV